MHKKFNLKPDRHTQKNFSAINNAAKFVNTRKKGKMYPISFIYVQTPFEHQLQDMLACLKLLVFYSFRTPKTRFRQEQSQQRQSAKVGSNIVTQNAKITVNGVQHQKRFNKKELRTELNCFQKQSNSYFIITCRNVRPEDAKT